MKEKMWPLNQRFHLVQVSRHALLPCCWRGGDPVEEDFWVGELLFRFLTPFSAQISASKFQNLSWIPLKVLNFFSSQVAALPPPLLSRFMSHLTWSNQPAGALHPTHRPHHRLQVLRVRHHLPALPLLLGAGSHLVEVAHPGHLLLSGRLPICQVFLLKSDSKES